MGRAGRPASDPDPRWCLVAVIEPEARLEAAPRPIGCRYPTHAAAGLDWERPAKFGMPAGLLCGICHPQPVVSPQKGA